MLDAIDPVDRSVQGMVARWDQNSRSDPHPNHRGDQDPPQRQQDGRNQNHPEKSREL